MLKIFINVKKSKKLEDGTIRVSFKAAPDRIKTAEELASLFNKMIEDIAEEAERVKNNE